MIDYHKEFVASLETVLPTHYEMTLHSGLETPCLSYMELNSYVFSPGETMEYSAISFQVKIWATDIATIQKYIVEVDNVLRPIGFKRTAATELYDHNSSMIQKILTYEALGLEEYDE